MQSFHHRWTVGTISHTAMNLASQNTSCLLPATSLIRIRFRIPALILGLILATSVGAGCEDVDVAGVVDEGTNQQPTIESEVVEETERSRKYALTASAGELDVAMYLREPLGRRGDDGSEVGSGRSRSTHGSRTGILLLAGFETGRAALDLIAERDDVVIASLDYPSHGLEDLYALEKEDAPVQKLQAIGEDTLRAATWAVTCLENRPDVDKTVVLGVSFGSVFATGVAAYDERVDGLVLVYGGGDLGRVVAANVERDQLPWWLPKFAFVNGARAGLQSLDPLNHIEKVSPRPVIMVNSPQDRYFPEETAELLFDAAKNPKELHWHDTEHMDLFDEDVLREVTGLVVERLEANGLM